MKENWYEFESHAYLLIQSIWHLFMGGALWLRLMYKSYFGTNQVVEIH